MGLLVSQVLEMSRSQHLQPGGANQETWDVQDGTLTSASASITTESLSDPLPEGAVIEWDDNTMEAALIKSSVGAVSQFQTRGYLDTVPAAHVDGTKIVVDSVYLKKVLYDALQATIAQLNGAQLYQIVPATGLTYQTSSLVTLPTGSLGVAGDIYVANGSTYNVLTPNSNFRVLTGFTPPKIQFLGGGIVGAALTINVKKDYVLPQNVTLGGGETVLDIDLGDDCGIPASLQMHLPLGVAAQVLWGRDIPQVDAEHIRRTQANAGVPVGARVNLGRTLWTQFMSSAVRAERDRLLTLSPPTISFERFG